MVAPEDSPEPGSPEPGSPEPGSPGVGEAQDQKAQDQDAQDQDAKERKERQEILDEMPKWKRTFFNIPVRHVNAQERMEQILLAQTEYDYRHGQAVALDSLKDRLAAVQLAARQDPLDKFRIVATLVMVAALFTIVYVVAIKQHPSTSLYQLVSLASGLAGIGLGWLFGAATTARTKESGPQ